MQAAACFWIAPRMERSMMVRGVTGCLMDEVLANGRADGSTREILNRAICTVAAACNSPMAVLIMADSSVMCSADGAHCKVVTARSTRATSIGGRATGRAVYARLTAVCTRESLQIVDPTATSRSALKSKAVWFFSRVYHTMARFSGLLYRIFVLVGLWLRGTILFVSATYLRGFGIIPRERHKLGVPALGRFGHYFVLRDLSPSALSVCLCGLWRPALDKRELRWLRKFSVLSWERRVFCF